MLRRYLIEYDLQSCDRSVRHHVPLQMGVAGDSLEDALNLVARWVLPRDEWPPVKRVVEDYDLGTGGNPWGEKLEGNMGVSVWRGVWLPLCNFFYGPDDGHNSPYRPEARRATAEDVEIYSRRIVGG